MMSIPRSASKNARKLTWEGRRNLGTLDLCEKPDPHPHLGAD